jgi:hypothetical protein
LTPQEQQLLNSLVERVNQTQLQEKDPDAEALLNQRLGGNTDALYILAQTVLVQNIALDQAKAQVAQLQQQAQQQRPQPAHATSFLGRLLGERDPEIATQQPPPYQSVNTGYAPQNAPPAPQYPQSQYVPLVGGQSSFLRGAMQTAAGVAAGALAFEGVEAILHGMGGGGYGFGGPGLGMGGGFGRPAEETVINNYYDEPGRGAEHGGLEHGSEHHFADSTSQLSDQGGSHLSEAGYDQGDNLRGFDQNDSSSASDFEDSSLSDQSVVDDNSSLDDNSGFDDGGGLDGDGGTF